MTMTILRIVLLVLSVGWLGDAHAQSSDSYWQRLIAQKEAQSAQQIVDLARALDAANKQIEDLRAQLTKQSEPPKK